MGPKRGKKKNNRDKDDDIFQFQDPTKQTKSKWEIALQQQQNQPDAQQLYANPKKQIFDFDFSDEKYLLKQQDPKHVHKDKYADLTPQQKQQLQRMREKAKIDKQEKAKVKNEKRKQRKKQQDIIKAKQQEQKQKQQQLKRLVQQEIKKNRRAKSSPWIIPLSLLGFLILMVVLQYHEQIHTKLAKFRNDDIDFYEILEIDQGATDKQIKSKYKKLVLKYHPDRNQNCDNCKQKFDKIMQAWQVLGNPEKRANYDRNSGVISQIKSSAVTLTPNNYKYLVQESHSIWLIQIYDSTNNYARYFNELWQQIIREYGDIVKFGRVDVWHQKDMLSYIPYRFAVFPGLYILDHGYSNICSLNYEKPLVSIRRCIDEHLESLQVKMIPQQQIKTKIAQKHKIGDKILAALSYKMRNSMRIKAINKMFEQYVQFNYLDVANSIYQKSVKIFNYHSKTPQSPNVYTFKDTTKGRYIEYSKFIQSNIVQKVSLCHFLNQCQQQKCIIILNPQQTLQKMYKQLPLPENKDRFPIFALKNNHQNKLLNEEVHRIQSQQGFFENFEIGVYQGGKIEFGYAHQIGQLDPSQGQLLDLDCKVQNWVDWLFRKGIEIKQLVYGTKE